MEVPMMILFRGRMPQTQTDFESYAWALNDDGTPNYEEPVENMHSHIMATVRYAVSSDKVPKPRVSGKRRNF